jgi:hypothetical protein
MKRIFLLFVIIVIILFALVYRVSCDKTKALKMELLRETQNESRDLELLVTECNESLGKIDEEISKLRRIIIEKKGEELETCKDEFDAKINLYKILYGAAYNRAITDAQIVELKRSVGITTL